MEAETEAPDGGWLPTEELPVDREGGARVAVGSTLGPSVEREQSLLRGSSQVPPPSLGTGLATAADPRYNGEEETEVPTEGGRPQQIYGHGG